MADSPATIPRRSLFKSSEVCEIVQVQPYVLRSWEAEFPDLGATTKGGVRVYRRADVELVLRLKQLLFVEGLTLAGARRKLEEERGPWESDEIPSLDELVSRNIRERLAGIRKNLQSIRDMLTRDGRETSFEVEFSKRARGGPRRPGGQNGPHKASPSHDQRAKPVKAGRRPARA